MSGGLYNAIFGYNPCTIIAAPLLCGCDPSEFFPRYRDCYITEKLTIVIYTRVGSMNRGYDYGEQKMEDMPTFVRWWDEEIDPTYGYYEFACPAKWSDDLVKIIDGDFEGLSDEYCSFMGGVWQFPDGDSFRAQLVDKKDNLGFARLSKAPDWEAAFAAMADEGVER